MAFLIKCFLFLIWVMFGSIWLSSNRADRLNFGMGAAIAIWLFVLYGLPALRNFFGGLIQQHFADRQARRQEWQRQSAFTQRMEETRHLMDLMLSYRQRGLAVDRDHALHLQKLIFELQLSQQDERLKAMALQAKALLGEE